MGRTRSSSRAAASAASTSSAASSTSSKMMPPPATPAQKLMLDGSNNMAYQDSPSVQLFSRFSSSSSRGSGSKTPSELREGEDEDEDENDNGHEEENSRQIKRQGGSRFIPSPQSASSSHSSASALESTLTSSRIETLKVSPETYKPFLLILLNFLFSQLLAALASPYIGAEMATVAKAVPEGNWWWVVPGWKGLEGLGVWFGGFDVTETMLLTILSRVPTAHFLSTFHPSISAMTLVAASSIDTVSIAVPLWLLRSESAPQHDRSSLTKHHHKHHHRRNKVLVDKPTYLSTTLLTSSIYASTLYTALKTFLTSYITIHTLFPETGVLESVVRVYNLNPTSWAATIVPVGIAVNDVVFARSLAESPVSSRKEGGTEEGGNFVKRFWHGLSPRTRCVVKRTLWVAGYMGGESFVSLGGIVKGGTVTGAGVVGGLWAAATVASGVVLGWIGLE